MCLKGRWKFLSENFWKLNGPYIAGSFGGLREPLATLAIHVVARSCYLLHSWYRTATQYHIYHHASEVGRTHRLYAVRHRDLRVVLDCRKNPSTAPGLPRLASVALALRHRLSPRANASLTASSSAIYWTPRRGPPPPPCTELDHGELLIPRPCLRRAHPASSSSTAPDMREKGASRCKGQGPKCEARCAGIDPSRTLELHCSSTASVSFSLRLQQAPQALAFASTTQALLMVVFATITTDGVKSLPPSCSALDLHGV